MKLYRVKLRGLANSTGTNYQTSYVVAEDPSSAYESVRDFLTEQGVGFAHDREMASIELLADDANYPACQTLLFLP